MIIAMNQFLLSLSRALDFAESELVGTMPHHAARVALLTDRLMRASGHAPDLCYAAAVASLLHDCALKEYLSDEKSLLKYADIAQMERDMQAHCIIGEKIGQRLPMYDSVRSAILYHHEQADGRGPLGKSQVEVPLYSQFIHIADMADIQGGLFAPSAEGVASLRKVLSVNRGSVFSTYCVDLFHEAIDDSFLFSLGGPNVTARLRDIFPQTMVEISSGTLLELSRIFADITDYKSHFTWRHSTGIAEKAFAMGRFYALSEEECRKLSIAGLLHDIGKLCIPNTILEKPGKLDPNEYREIQNHAMGTWELLKDIAGMEDIASWAALHHEKLDGSGYPFGYASQRLSRNDRLMACLDIYQALTEERPYKAGLSHHNAMEILEKMGAMGQLDRKIIHDIDTCFASSASVQEQEDNVFRQSKELTGTVYRCPVCGYVYEGDLPKDFICPRCEQPASVFERISV